MTLNLFHSFAQHSCARRALRARARLLSSGLTSAAGISGRSNRPPWRAERCVASAGIIFPVGGPGRDWSPPCLVFVTLNLFHYSAQHSCARRALRARARLLSSGLTSAAGISGRLKRPPWRAERCVASAGMMFPVGGPGRDWCPPCLVFVTLNLFHSLLCSACFARARTALQQWAHERGWHLWAPKQAALADRALRGKSGHNNPCGGAWSGLVPPLPGFCDP